MRCDICWQERYVFDHSSSSSNIKHEFDLIVDLSKHDRFAISFHLTGLLITGRFVARDTNMKEIRRNLLSSNTSDERKIYILYGLDGIEKTQLTVAYLREHQELYSAILWLNGNSKDTLMQSLVAFDKHAGLHFVSEAATAKTQDSRDFEAKARAVLRWLALSRNRRWLMIVDNVDREYSRGDEDPLTYDIQFFLSLADHEYIMITSRLPSLVEIEISTEIKRLDVEQTLELVCDRSGLPHDTEGKRSSSC